jgi:hypothetical protein
LGIRTVEPVNAIVLALTLTAVVILDYAWELFEDRLKGKKWAWVSKAILVGVLVLAGWGQALLQYRRDSESDRDTKYLKEQLTLANTSLTNATAVVKGLTTGGDYLPEIYFGLSETNAVSLTLMSKSDYPLRHLYVKVTDKTGQADYVRTNAPPPPPKVLFERFLGDFPGDGWIGVGTVELKPAGTNYVRVDIEALNGTCWEIFYITQANKTFAVQLYYRWRQLSGHKAEIDPPSMRGVLVVD